MLTYFQIRKDQGRFQDMVNERKRVMALNESLERIVSHTPFQYYPITSSQYSPITSSLYFPIHTHPFLSLLPLL